MKRLMSLFLFSIILFLLFLGPVATSAQATISFVHLQETYTSGSMARFGFYSPLAGTATLLFEDESQKTLATIIKDFSIKSGNNHVEWALSLEDSPLEPGTYGLRLTIGNETQSAQITVVDPEPLAFQPTADDSPVVPDAEPQQSAAANEDSGFKLIDTQSDLPKFAPSDYSPHDCEHEVCFWNLPIGDMNEQAIWDAMMQPITVIKATRKTAADRQGFNIYSDPDEDSTVVAEVTAVSQGLHVLKHLDNDWSLVEGYSSSFHNSRVKNYGGFFQGYIKTSRLETKQPSEKYGLLMDKLTQRMYIFENGKIISELLLSTGLPTTKQPYNETPAGEFLVVSWTGGFYSGNMYCDMALRINAGILIHEVPCLLNDNGGRNYAPFEPLLGQKASHGCVRIQRALTPEGTNMRWLWDNLKMNTRVFIWEDKGRMIDAPADDTPVYYNADGGQYFHGSAYCPNVKERFLPLTEFPYSQLEQEPFSKLKPCAHCNPPMRKSEVDAINAQNALTPHDGGNVPAVTIPADTQLYYNPNGGSYYHRAETCSTVSAKYLPLTAFLYQDLGHSPYNELSPCLSCSPYPKGLTLAEAETLETPSFEESTATAQTASPSAGTSPAPTALPLPEEGESLDLGGDITFTP